MQTSIHQGLSKSRTDNKQQDTKNNVKQKPTSSMVNPEFQTELNKISIIILTKHIHHLEGEIDYFIDGWIEGFNTKPMDDEVNGLNGKKKIPQSYVDI